MTDCGRCGFPTNEPLKVSTLEPWVGLCPICKRAESVTINRQKQAKRASNKGLTNFLEAETIKQTAEINIFKNAFKVNIQEKEEEIVEDEQTQDVSQIRPDKWWMPEAPIQRVPGTLDVMGRFKGFGGQYYLNEEAKNVLSLADIRSYQGKKREVTARWLLENFSNNGDVVLDPFSGSGMFSMLARLLEENQLHLTFLSPQWRLLQRLYRHHADPISLEWDKTSWMLPPPLRSIPMSTRKPFLSGMISMPFGLVHDSSKSSKIAKITDLSSMIE